MNHRTAWCLDWNACWWWRAVADLEVVPESQVPNLAQVNLAMGHEVLQLAESSEVAYSAVVDLEVAYINHQNWWHRSIKFL